MANTKTLYEKIIAELPELAENQDEFAIGTIRLQNDGDGDFISKWEYSKPIPTSLESYYRA